MSERGRLGFLPLPPQPLPCPPHVLGSPLQSLQASFSNSSPMDSLIEALSETHLYLRAEVSEAEYRGCSFGCEMHKEWVLYPEGLSEVEENKDLVSFVGFSVKMEDTLGGQNPLGHDRYVYCLHEVVRVDPLWQCSAQWITPFSEVGNFSFFDVFSVILREDRGGRNIYLAIVISVKAQWPISVSHLNGGCTFYDEFNTLKRKLIDVGL